MIFKNAQEAFEWYYNNILKLGICFDGTLAMFNQGFTILNPLDNKISTPWRKWKNNYAEIEWEWYLSKDRNIKEISKHAKIWKSIASKEGNVNSNYGYQWSRGNQLEYAIKLLKENKNTRKASISLFDGKENSKYGKDTVCTYAINFTVIEGKLNMSVLMRSNDLVFGFCNDQYCFSKLQELVCKKTGYKMGTYYHFAQNLHIYGRHFNMKNK